jgi:hypothetical protein
MGRHVTIVLYVVAMAAVIVGVGFRFRNRFWERLTFVFFGFMFVLRVLDEGECRQLCLFCQNYMHRMLAGNILSAVIAECRRVNTCK